MAVRKSPLEDVGVEQPFWTGKRVLVTGHTGFKGAWLCLWLEKLGAEVTGFALPSTGPETAYEALRPSLDSRIGDIRDSEAVADIVQQSDPQVVFHLAAHSLVRPSYKDPATTYEVNVLGTLNLLKACLAAASLEAVVVVTTDKVYRNTEEGEPFEERDPLGGLDPYSSSKACVEILTESWRQSFLSTSEVKVTTARAGNVIGGGDWGEDRLIPDTFRALRSGVPVLLRYPDAVRPWQFVLDPLCGYLLLAQRREASGPASFNFGPASSSESSASDVVEKVLTMWGSGGWQLAEGSHDAESQMLRLNPALARKVLAWETLLDLDAALEWTVAWHRHQTNGGDMRSFSLAQIERYAGLARA